MTQFRRGADVVKMIRDGSSWRFWRVSLTGVSFNIPLFVSLDWYSSNQRLRIRRRQFVPSSLREEPKGLGMNSSHICLSCRRALGQLGGKKVVRLQQRASFISLNNRAKTTTEGNPPTDAAQPKGRGDSKTIPGRPRKGKQKGNGVRENKSSSNALESLFQESLHPSTSSAETHSQPSTVLELYKNVDTLKRILLQGDDVADAWLFFVEHFGPDSEKHPFDKTLVSRALLKDVIMAKRKHPLSETLPNVTEVSTISYQ